MLNKEGESTANPSILTAELRCGSSGVASGHSMGYWLSALDGMARNLGSSFLPLQQGTEASVQILEVAPSIAVQS